MKIVGGNNKKDMTLQTVFDKIFGSEINGATQLADITDGMSTTDIRTDIILGALRNILLVCEICKTTRHESATRDPSVGRQNFPGKFDYLNTWLEQGCQI